MDRQTDAHSDHRETDGQMDRLIDRQKGREEDIEQKNGQAD
jgi:hypothetical protein